MAFDTQTKRAGALGIHIHPLHPTGDGTINQGDRQMVVGIYPGILAAVSIVGWLWRRTFGLSHRGRYRYGSYSVRGSR